MLNDDGIELWQVDAFTDRPFAGNPAAVCVLDRFPSDRWMQDVAAEMNLSETSFVVATDRPGHFDLRWFTPATEVDLCGHATLATAHVLLERDIVDRQHPIRFNTRSGELLCEYRDHSITMDFPSTPPRPCDSDTLAREACDALGVGKAIVLQSPFDLLVIVDDGSIVESALPDFSALTKLQTRGVMLTSPSTRDGIDFVSRFFAPSCGINEDPVTGSAHCCLAPYWAQVFGRQDLVGYQASSRGGIVTCKIVGDRVHLSGNAVTVMQARLKVAIDH
ncbi:PhzF family phenazine biosynthesis protein [Stieleria sp. JC731]|uniref:PhzF family phenazine biosynthesis protein n=1 Tax=Pirellulaceae TaxID=2691357 RepID=UPI001E4BD1FF|nr:PhzF family phenazine biosynthesis protein [Stieleria sp. JC731]MCC9600695.1 PhzF family phenazine biosynthesis protein [Stieleria sp. JC731]